MKRMAILILLFLFSPVLVQAENSREEFIKSRTVVVISAYQVRDSWRHNNGSGVLLSRDYILTDAHVLTDFPALLLGGVEIKIYDGNLNFLTDAVVAGIDWKTDQALLKTSAPLKVSGQILVNGDFLGQEVTMAGYINGGAKFKVVNGGVNGRCAGPISISAQELEFTLESPLNCASAKAYPGMSGGGVWYFSENGIYLTGLILATSNKETAAASAGQIKDFLKKHYVLK